MLRNFETGSYRQAISRPCISAEFHWPVFHSLINKSEILSSENRRQNFNNPHILDCFFLQKKQKALLKNGFMI